MHRRMSRKRSDNNTRSFTEGSKKVGEFVHAFTLQYNPAYALQRNRETRTTYLLTTSLSTPVYLFILLKILINTSSECHKFSLLQKREVRLFTTDGRPLNTNPANIQFKFTEDEENNCFVLEVNTYRWGELVYGCRTETMLALLQQNPTVTTFVLLNIILCSFSISNYILFLASIEHSGHRIYVSISMLSLYSCKKSEAKETKTALSYVVSSFQALGRLSGDL